MQDFSTRGWWKNAAAWGAARTRRFWATAASCAALWFLLMPASWQYSGRLFYAVGAAAGFPLFMAIGAAVYLWLPVRTHRRFSRSLAAMLVMGAAVESLQAVTGRDPRWGHGVVLAMGGCAGALWMDGGTSGRRWWLLVTRGLILALAVLAAWPVVLVLADRLQAQLSFPVLSSFEGRSETGRWWSHNCRLSRVTTQATHGRHALRVGALKTSSRYPGVFMNDVPHDWSRYHRLCMDIFLVGSTEQALWVRADDRAGYPPYGDRAQTMLHLSPGPNSICLDLASFLVTPGGRSLDRAQVVRWGLFFDEARGGETFILDHVRLVP